MRPDGAWLSKRIPYLLLRRLSIEIDFADMGVHATVNSIAADVRSPYLEC
jgi:hypothetical protein